VKQTSTLAKLPSHVVTNVAQVILRDGETQPVNPQQDLNNLLSMCRTSQSFRQLHLPESTWAALAIGAVNRYRDELVQRWRSNPSGRGGIGEVWIALDNMMMQPVKDALAVAEAAAEKRSRVSLWQEDEEEGCGYTARDVLYWWLYSDAWRSRRRVWYCVVHASATARNADWW